MSEREVLLLRFDAPLMSFGGVAVDQHGVTAEFPARSMLTGLVANALGYDHGEAARLERLQERLRYAVRRDRRGEALVDYQTVDLSQEFMRHGWTTWGRPIRRSGGKASTGTHIRYRHYCVDAVYTVAMTLEPADETPRIQSVEERLREPERPLFLGRKPCLPATPLLLDSVQAPSLYAALCSAPLAARAVPEDEHFAAWWPRDGEPSPPAETGRLLPVTDERDWANQIHTGRRFVWQGRISQEEVADGSG